MSQIDYEKAKRKDSAKIYRVGRNVRKIPWKIPPTESQLQLIAKLKEKLEDAGKDISYLTEPEDKFIAQHVLGSLIRLCKKYNL